MFKTLPRKQGATTWDDTDVALVTYLLRGKVYVTVKQDNHLFHIATIQENFADGRFHQVMKQGESKKTKKKKK